MKVPNKVLGAVLKLVKGEAVDAEERALVLKWACEGSAKRAAAAAAPQEA